MDPLDTKDTIEGISKQVHLDDSNLASQGFAKRVALLTSIIALLAAIASIMSARCTTRGVVAQNESILIQNQITNHWAFFQSRNIRAEIAESSMVVLQHMGKKELLREIEKKHSRLLKEADDLYKQSENLNQKEVVLRKKSNDYLEVSRLFAVALVLLQVALVLTTTSIVAQSRRLVVIAGLLVALSLPYFIQAYWAYFKLWS